MNSKNSGSISPRDAAVNLNRSMQSLKQEFELAHTSIRQRHNSSQPNHHKSQSLILKSRQPQQQYRPQSSGPKASAPPRQLSSSQSRATLTQNQSRNPGSSSSESFTQFQPRATSTQNQQPRNPGSSSSQSFTQFQPRATSTQKHPQNPRSSYSGLQDEGKQIFSTTIILLFV